MPEEVHHKPKGVRNLHTAVARVNREDECIAVKRHNNVARRLIDFVKQHDLAKSDEGKFTPAAVKASLPSQSTDRERHCEPVRNNAAIIRLALEEAKRARKKHAKKAAQVDVTEDDQGGIEDEPIKPDMKFNPANDEIVFHKKSKKVILAQGETLEIGYQRFKLCSAMVGNHGMVEMYDDAKQAYNIHFESSRRKGRRVKVISLIHVIAAAANRKHMLRLLQRGVDKNLRIRYFITDAFGPTLYDVQAKRPFHKFTVGTATRLAIETLNAVEDLHVIGYTHRDIKPTCFVIGRDNENHIYLTKFTNVRKFRTKDSKIIPPRLHAPFVSSVRYASRACHDNSECSRKDDLESWLFMSAEFYQSAILSWRFSMNVVDIRRQKDIFMTEKDAKSLTMDYPSLPGRFPNVVSEVASYKFDTTPNYELLREAFKKHLDSRVFKISNKWDWISTSRESTDSVENTDCNAKSPVKQSVDKSTTERSSRKMEDSSLVVRHGIGSESLVPRS